LPMHVLIEPKDHKLVLIDWCCAMHQSSPSTVQIIEPDYLRWYKRQGATNQPPTPALDIGLGARSMIELLGGDALNIECVSQVEPALVRYFKRCVADGAPTDAWKLLSDFDRVIEALWGPRQFVELKLPPK